MKYFLILAAIASMTTSSGASTVDEIVSSTSIRSPLFSKQKTFWAGFSIPTSFSFNQIGAAISTGCQLTHFGFDLNASMGSTTFGNLFIKPNDPTVFDDADPESELLRFRTDSDRWSFFYFGPGISVSSHFFPELLPNISEKIRVGFNIGSANDKANNLDFGIYLFSVETSFLYQWSQNLPWTANLSVFWNTGDLVARSPADSPTSQRRLPTNWMGFSLGLSYYFTEL